MISHLPEALNAGVEALLRDVSTSIIMPRFRHLATGEIEEKTPGEVVTVADRQAEVALAAGLSGLLPAARVIGEEACSSNPSLLKALDSGLLWIVDPLDGTANFAAGREPFGTIIALARDGVTVGAWLFDPVSGRSCRAARGAGAWIDGIRVHVPGGSTGRPIAALATQFMRPEPRTAMLAKAANEFDVVPIPRCAAEHYPRLALGQNHVALFQRTLPWDHAAGALFLIEAGGSVARWDGTPYVFHDDGLGIIAATSETLWRRAARLVPPPHISSAYDILPQRLDVSR